MKTFPLLVLVSLATGLSACGSSESDSNRPGPKDAGGDSTVDSGSDAPSTEDAATDAGGDAPTTEDAGTDSGNDAAAEAGPSWQLPQCSSVQGTGAVTFTKDDGATLAPTFEPLVGTVYTRGLVALQVPNTLLAASGSNLLRSEDAGCNWQVVATLPGSIMSLVRGVGDRAFGYQDNDQPLVRIDGATVTTPKSPTPNVVGMGADATNPDRLRLAGSDGSIWESLDAGATFDPVSTAPAPGLTYRFAFDPQDLDHVLFGAAVEGASVSFDGGKLWKKSTGLSPSGKANAFEVIVSPVDSKVVWAQGIDLDENLTNAANEGRHIFRSVDGGLTFTRVVDHEPGVVTLTNGVLMAPSPKDTAIVYFEFGTYFQGYGTDLFKFDATTKALTKTHNDNDDISSIVFSPADPTLLYLGLTQEKIQ